MYPDKASDEGDTAKQVLKEQQVRQRKIQESNPSIKDTEATVELLVQQQATPRSQGWDEKSKQRGEP